MLSTAALARVETAVGDHLRTHPLKCRDSATPAGPCDIGAYRGRGERPPLCAPLLVPRKCHTCQALRHWRV
eukprot:8422122-Pyramimonas_sp.AAC.1